MSDSTGSLQGVVRRGLVLAAAAALLACSSSLPQRAPVQDIAVPGQRVINAGEPAPAVVPNENAGKPGYYSVKAGDTLIRIGLDAGQNWRDIARWNGLDKPNLIEVGQVLRVAPPGAAGEPGVVVRPVNSAVVTPVPDTSTPRGSPTATVALTPAASAAPASVAGKGSDEDISWSWPANGKALAGFDEVKNKGLDLGGQAGDAVVAAADGRVVYAGADLRGYGNLIILKHNNTFLTAYAHNQALLVKEDQSVRRGQKIAEMGSSDADRVKLHFEIRRQGKPVDPTRYLPAR